MLFSMLIISKIMSLRSVPHSFCQPRQAGCARKKFQIQQLLGRLKKRHVGHHQHQKDECLKRKAHGLQGEKGYITSQETRGAPNAINRRMVRSICWRFMALVQIAFGIAVGPIELWRAWFTMGINLELFLPPFNHASLASALANVKLQKCCADFWHAATCEGQMQS